MSRKRLKRERRPVIGLDPVSGVPYIKPAPLAAYLEHTCTPDSRGYCTTCGRLVEEDP